MKKINTMRLIFLISFLFVGFLKSQDLESKKNDSISISNSVFEIDSLVIASQSGFPLDSIPKLNNVPVIKVKTKTDLAKKDSLLEINKKSKIVRYRKIVMDTILIKNYKISNEDDSSEFVDTTLNILKDYKFNYLRKDYFEFLPMPNVGQGFNKMGYDFVGEKIKPQLGATARNDGYIEREDVQYYEVPTPLTELFFKTTFDQGQLLDALISVNTSPNFNITFAHKGLRSLGNYVNSRTNATNLRFSTQYKNYNERYRLRTHIVTQKLSSQENGGIDSLSVYFFEKAIEDLEYDGFLDRARLVTNLEALNTIQGKRYFATQEYKLIPSSKDSLKYKLTIGHNLMYETKNHTFIQNKSNDFLGQNLIVSSNGNPVSDFIQDIHKLRVIENKFFAIYDMGLVGTFDLGLQFDKWNYFKENTKPDEFTFDTNQQLIINQQTIIGGWNKSLLGYLLELKIQKTLKNNFGNSIFDFQIAKKYQNQFYINAGFQYRTESPNFNFYLFRSSYVNYNWNNDDWLLQKTTALTAEIGHPKWGVLSMKIQGIDDYLFFKDTTPKDQINKIFTIYPTQSKDRLNYVKTRFFQHLKFWKFGLINTVQYQKVVSRGQDSDFMPLNVPEWITRSSLVLETFLFKRALFIQTGATFQYFSKYYANQYHPILGEFASQNHTQIGNFPRVDLFLNAKIQKTRLFLKYEHFNSDRTGYDYYSSPFVPYRDGVIRFGLGWNMFQ